MTTDSLNHPVLNSIDETLVEASTEVASSAVGSGNKPAREPLPARLNEWLLGGILAVMSVLQFTNVLVRYLTNESVPWAEEVSRHLMVWLVFLGLGSAYRIGIHMAIDNLHKALSPRQARFLRAVLVAILVISCIMLSYQGWVYVERSKFQMTSATEIPFSYIYMALPTGFVLLLLHVLAIARKYIGTGEFIHSDSVNTADVSGL